MTKTMQAIKGVKWAIRATAVASWLGAAIALATWNPGPATSMAISAVTMTYVGWVVTPEQEYRQRTIERLRALDRKNQSARYEWETK